MKCKELDQNNTRIVEAAYKSSLIDCTINEFENILNSTNQVISNFAQIDNIINLVEFKEFFDFGQNSYLDLLISSNSIFNQDNIEPLLKNLKRIYYLQCFTQSSSAKAEYNLLKTLGEGFELEEYNKDVVGILKRRLANLCHNDKGEVMHRIAAEIERLPNFTSNTCSKLLTSLKSVSKEETLMLIEQYLKLLSYYRLNEVPQLELEMGHEGNFRFLTVSGMNHNLTDIVKKIESYLHNHGRPIDYVDEIRLLLHILKVDCDLKNDMWHGANIIICAKKIIVMQESRWDLSGKDATEFSNDSLGMI